MLNTQGMIKLKSFQMWPLTHTHTLFWNKLCKHAPPPSPWGVLSSFTLTRTFPYNLGPFVSFSVLVSFPDRKAAFAAPDGVTQVSDFDLTYLAG